MIERGV